MDAEHRPQHTPHSAAEQQLQAWQVLHQRLLELHAQLEYLRLMLKLRQGLG